MYISKNYKVISIYQFKLEIKAKNGSHAFVNLTNKCGIFQGSPVDFDKLNDYSIESTELTPTVDTVTKTSKFMNNDSNIMRAKELVSRYG